ncbi:MAG TPA: DUF1003 domain-containing protein [Galbitalea sp.]
MRTPFDDTEVKTMSTQTTLPKRTIIRPSALLRRGGVHHPAVVDQAQQRAASIQLRIADAITAFAGSMNFVYLHVVIFAAWMLWAEKSPWPTLTLIVSLEAIFLSTFVMIGQNRQAAFQQAKADRDFGSTEKELHSNTTMTKQIEQLTKRIEQLTTEIHDQVITPPRS